MIDVKEEIKVCDWLISQGFTLQECAYVLFDVMMYRSFGEALLNVFHNRNLLLEKGNAKNNDISDWGAPITP